MGPFHKRYLYLSLELIDAAALVVPPMVLEVVGHLIIQIDRAVNVLVNVKN